MIQKYTFFQPKDYSRIFGWEITEKLDGRYALYLPATKGRQVKEVSFANIAKRPHLGNRESSGLWSRGLTPLFPPKEWAAEWLDILPMGGYAGELWHPDGLEASGVAQSFGGDWTGIRYNIFDILPVGINEYVTTEGQNLNPVPFLGTVESRNQLMVVAREAINRGAEGLVIRKPNTYHVGRTRNVLKFKPYADTVVQVNGYTEGQGRNEGRIGALVCQYGDKTFNVGGGLSDYLRDNPPAIGSLIKIKYRRLSKYGVPTEPSFVEVCDESK